MNWILRPIRSSSPIPPPFQQQGLASQVLLVFNVASSDSVAVMQYYLANRPGMANIDVLELNCATTEQLDYTDVVNTIRTPIRNFIASSPYKKVYVIMCRGIPSRTTGQPAGSLYSSPSVDETVARADPNWSNSVGTEYMGVGSSGTYLGNNSGVVSTYNTPYSSAAFPGTSFLVTRMDMGSLAATEAYINKLATMYGAMPSPNIVISAAASGNGGTNYVFDDMCVATYQGSDQAEGEYTAITSAAYNDISTSRCNFQNNFASTPIEAAADLKGYYSWGVHNGVFGGNYPFDGTLKWSGKSSWYIVATVESFNGIISSGQGWFGAWFNATGGNGTGYANTPVGMSCQTDEPSASGIANQAYYCNWELGMNFAMCAWSSRVAPSSFSGNTVGTGGFMAVGDPLVVA